MEVVMNIERGSSGVVVDYTLHVDDQDRWLEICQQWGVTYLSEQAANDMFELCTAAVVGIGFDPALFPWVELADSLPAEDSDRPICIYRALDGQLAWQWQDEVAEELASYRKPPPTDWKPAHPALVMARRAVMRVIAPRPPTRRRDLCPA
jgi:hypothetical protein